MADEKYVFVEKSKGSDLGMTIFLTVLVTGLVMFGLWIIKVLGQCVYHGCKLAKEKWDAKHPKQETK